MPLSPYLSFAGNCSDAIAYYQRTLGAELLYKSASAKCRNQRRTAPKECNFPIPPSRMPTCALPEATS